MRRRLASLARVIHLQKTLEGRHDAHLTALLKNERDLKAHIARLLEFLSAPSSPTGLVEQAHRHMCGLAASCEVIAEQIDRERERLTAARRKGETAKRLSSKLEESLRATKERRLLEEIALLSPSVSRKAPQR